MTAIELVPLRWSTIPATQRLAARIFPHEARAILACLIEALLPAWLRRIAGSTIDRVNYYLVRRPGESISPVGLTGFYTLRLRPDEVWLGWYGVDVSQRGRGFGRAILQASIDWARERGYNILRLWTTDNPSLTATAARLYREFGFVSQNTDYAYYGHPVLIYSLAFEGSAPPLDAARLPQALVGANRRKLSLTSYLP